MSAFTVALAGGVGGAKLAHGLNQLLERKLAIIVNTADDFEHLGLTITPDIDTVLYTLAGIANHSQGWGIEGESWSFIEQLAHLDLPTWFRLGDRDLATHILRSLRLREGARPTEIAAELAERLGVTSTVLPMSDHPVRTFVTTTEGELPFQEYFVRLKCEVAVNGFRFSGAEGANLSPEVIATLQNPDLRAIIFCPSNPYVSIDPILSVPSMRDAIVAAKVPIVAVSPIVAGNAIKGPAAKMMMELGCEVSALGIARHYQGLIDGIVIDESDRELAVEITALGMLVRVTNTIMNNDSDRKQLAVECLDFAAQIPGLGN